MGLDRSWLQSAPVEAFVIDDLEVRRFRREDAAAVVQAVTESIEHLRPWMPWIAYEPQSIEQRATLIDEWNKEWVQCTGFHYGVFRGSRQVAGCGFHLRSAPAILEIGYWVHVNETGRGLASALSQRLTDVAFALSDVQSVEIVHDVANIASGRVPQKLGYVMVEEFERMSDPQHLDTPLAPGESGTARRWRITRDQWLA